MEDNVYDIIIVGAGVVGATLANLIVQSEANRSMSIALVDQGIGGNPWHHGT